MRREGEEGREKRKEERDEMGRDKGTNVLTIAHPPKM